MAHNYYNNAHPNSIMATSDPETRKRIRRRMKAAARDEQVIKAWAKQGCTAGADSDRGSFILADVIGLDDPERSE